MSFSIFSVIRFGWSNVSAHAQPPKLWRKFCYGFYFCERIDPKKIMSSMLFHLWHTWCTRLKVSGLKKCRSRHLTVLPVPAPGNGKACAFDAKCKILCDYRFQSIVNCSLYPRKHIKIIKLSKTEIKCTNLTHPLPLIILKVTTIKKMQTQKCRNAKVLPGKRLPWEWKITISTRNLKISEIIILKLKLFHVNKQWHLTSSCNFKQDMKSP
jgi:hypothetical protein